MLDMFREYAARHYGLMNDDLSDDEQMEAIVYDGMDSQPIQHGDEHNLYFHELEMGKKMAQLWENVYG